MRPNQLPAQLRTERLLLRPPRLEDAKACLEGYAQDPEVTRYLTWKPVPSLADEENFLRRLIAVRAAGTTFAWMLTQPPADQPIGVVEARLAGHSVSLGYLLRRSDWGNGYMPEAVQAVIDAALAVPQFFRVWAVCDVDNVASARVMEKAGMVREGRLARYVVHPNISDEPRDVFIYAKVR